MINDDDDDVNEINNGALHPLHTAAVYYTAASCCIWVSQPSGSV